MTQPLHIITQRYNTPCGDLILGAYGDLLYLCDWADSARHSQSCLRLMRGLRADMREGDSQVLTETKRQLEEYFARERQVFDLPIGRVGTAFQQKVWEALEGVAFGQTISYAELSERIGQPKAIRAVGTTIGNNPHSILVPCHRIIGSDRSLTGYAGGLEAKRYLLELEGVSIK